MQYEFIGLNHAFHNLTKETLRSMHYIEQAFSRNGRVFRWTEPVTIQYLQSTDNCLLYTGRDANPFFHLYEAMWMLAGRRDLRALEYYNSNMRNYSDDGYKFNAPYGVRWSGPGPVNQLSNVIRLLTQDPDTRRAYIGLYWPAVDGPKLGQDGPSYTSKDIACNVGIKFSIRKGMLRMTVFNRSNDLFWGLLGANYVHFSILHQFVANSVPGCRVGSYYHITDDLHFYEEQFPLDRRKEMVTDAYVQAEGDFVHFDLDWRQIGYIKEMADAFDGDYDDALLDTTHSPWMLNVWIPAMQAFQMHKRRDYTQALACCAVIRDWRWRLVCTKWIEKRCRLYESNHPVPNTDEC